jgi:hypothetical protein
MQELKEPTLRQIVRIYQKETLSNRHETYALRSEIAVMRTEIAGIHKLLTESNMQFVSIAQSLRGVNAELRIANMSLQKTMLSIKEVAIDLSEKFEQASDIETEGDDLASYASVPINIGDIIDIGDIDEKTERVKRCSYAQKGDNGNETQCCLKQGHKGDHMFKCNSPNCPGYPFSHESSHPINTCPTIPAPVADSPADTEADEKQ